MLNEYKRLAIKTMQDVFFPTAWFLRVVLLQTGQLLAITFFNLSKHFWEWIFNLLCLAFEQTKE